VSENQNVLMMKPVKAFMYQDHQAHIMVHMSAMQDPKIMSLLQNNPMAQQLQAAMMAHVAEHVGLAYRQKIEQQLGMPLPPEGDKMAPQVEIALSGMMAQAAAQVLQQSQAQAQQQQAQQQAQDPLLQLQQQELQLRQQEVQTKGQEVTGKLQLEQQRLQLDQQRLQMDAMAKMEQAKQNSKKIQLDALAKAGQLKAQKKDQQHNALAKAGDLQVRKQQINLQSQQQANQQPKEPSTK